MTTLPDFLSVGPIPAPTVTKYSGQVPQDVLDLWSEVGLGSALNGFLRSIDPLEWAPILREIYPGHDDAVALFATAFADVVVWERGYLNVLRCRRGVVSVLVSDLEMLLLVLGDQEFLDSELDAHSYPAAVERLGQPAFDECFGYVPLLALGGPERVENLQRVKMREHVLLISQLAGPLGFDAG